MYNSIRVKGFSECVPGCYVSCGCSTPNLIFTVKGVYPFVLSLSILFYVTRLVASCTVLCNYEIKVYFICSYILCYLSLRGIK
jgi:hypothetical protein